MLIERDDDVEVVSETRTCEYHKKNPEDRNYPGCTCSGSWGLRKKRRPAGEKPEEPQP